jgi:hypothetical protein
VVAAHAAAFATAAATTASTAVSTATSTAVAAATIATTTVAAASAATAAAATAACAKLAHRRQQARLKEVQIVVPGQGQRHALPATCAIGDEGTMVAWGGSGHGTLLLAVGSGLLAAVVTVIVVFYTGGRGGACKGLAPLFPRGEEKGEGVARVSLRCLRRDLLVSQQPVRRHRRRKRASPCRRFQGRAGVSCHHRRLRRGVAVRSS